MFLHRLLTTLSQHKTTDARDRAMLAVILSELVLHIPDDTLAGKMDVSTSTIERWRSGSHAPPSGMRAVTYRRLAEIVLDLIS